MKILKILFAFILVLALMPTIAVVADRPITVTVNGQPVGFSDQLPVIIDGRVLVPARGVFEKLGFRASWNEAAQRVRLEGVHLDIEFRIGSVEYMTFNDMGVRIRRLDIPAQIINGRAMVPLRAVAEAIGGIAEWDAENRIASVIKLPVGVGGVLNYAVVSSSPFSGIHNPVFGVLSQDGTVNDFMFTGLLNVYDNNHYNNLGAAWFEYDVDAATFTIHFHDSTAMYWWDGVPVTMYDLKFAYEIIAHPDIDPFRFGPANNTGTVLGIAEYRQNPNVGISGIRVFNSGRSIEFSYGSIDPSIRIGAVWATPMPRHHFDGIPIAEMESHPNSRTNPLGNGAFMYAGSVPGESVSLVANPRYWRGAPKLCGIDIQLVHPDLIGPAMMAGLIDLVHFPMTLVPWYENRLDNVTFTKVLDRRLDFMGFRHGTRNHTTGIITPNTGSYINCVYLRRALGYARDDITTTEVLFHGLRFPIATTIVPWQGDVMYTGIEEGFSRFDLSKANEILDNAGYEWRAGEPFRRHNVTGEPFVLVWLIANNFAENFDKVSFHRANWARVGLNVVLFEDRLVTLTERTQILTYDTDNGIVHFYDATWLVGSNPNPSGIWGNLSHNGTRYTSPRLDTILNNINSQQAWDMDWLRQQYVEFQRYVYEQAPWIPISSGYQVWAASDRVLNFSPDRSVVDPRVPGNARWHLWDLRRQT